MRIVRFDAVENFTPRFQFQWKRPGAGDFSRYFVFYLKVRNCRDVYTDVCVRYVSFQKPLQAVSGIKELFIETVPGFDARLRPQKQNISAPQKTVFGNRDTH